MYLFSISVLISVHKLYSVGRRNEASIACNVQQFVIRDALEIKRAISERCLQIHGIKLISRLHNGRVLQRINASYANKFA